MTDSGSFNHINDEENFRSIDVGTAVYGSYCTDGQ